MNTESQLLNYKKIKNHFNKSEQINIHYFIRKVLGASVTNIIFLFSKEFMVLITLAFVVAAPIAYRVMHSWLESFAYRIDIGTMIFVIAFVSSLLVAVITIGYQAMKAAIANPVKSLRME